MSANAQPIIIPCATEEAWHAERAKTIGASEVPSLFGQGYKTRRELWLSKKGLLPHEPASDAMLLGQDLEEGNARNYARKHGRKVVTPQDFYGHPGAFAVIVRHPTLPLACTPDRIIITEGETGLLQLKNFGAWAATEDDEIPVAVQLQIQAELLCTGLAWGAAGMIVGGSKRLDRDLERHEKAQEMIAYHVTRFWSELQGETPPEPDAGDLDRIKAAWPTAQAGLSVELDAPELVYTLATVKARLAQLEEEEKALAAKLIERIGPAETVTSSGRKLATYKTQTRTNPPREASVSTFRTLRIDKSITDAAKAALPPRHEQPLLA